MPDVITPEERALIDAAIASGATKLIPPGVSSYAGYRWCEKTRRVVLIDWEERKEKASTLEIGRDRLNAHRAKAAEIRRESLLALIADGKDRAEIAGILGLNPRTVVSMIRELREAGRLK